MTMAALAISLAASEDGAELRRLTLTEGVHLAISQNRGLKIARLKVTESEQKKAGERSAYFPSITNQSNALHVTDPQNIGIPAGSLGTAAGSLVPAQNVVLPQGQKTFFSSGTMISQPLTQLIRIHQANRRSGADITVSKDDLKNSENQIALQVHNLYFGILIARLQKQAAEQQRAYATENLRESEDDVRNGSALRVASIQGRAGLFESRQAVLTAELQVGEKDAHGALVGDVGPNSPAQKSGIEKGDIIKQNGQKENSVLSGVSVENLDAESAQDLKLPTNAQGVVVTNVSPSSEAADAGLRRGDVIQEVNHKPVKNTSDFEHAVGNSKEDTLLLVNRNGSTMYLAV
jgi:S1-C subfamily serine protease